VKQHKLDALLAHCKMDGDVVRALAENLRNDGVRIGSILLPNASGSEVDANLEQQASKARLLVLCHSANVDGTIARDFLERVARFRDPKIVDHAFLVLCLDKSQPGGSLAHFVGIGWTARDQNEYEVLLARCRRSIIGSVRARDKTVLKQRYKLQSPSDLDISTYAFDIDRRRIVTGSGNAIHVWDFENGRQLRTLSGHTSTVYALSMAADGQTLLSGAHADDSKLRLWDMNTGNCLRQFDKHEGSAFEVLLDTENDIAISAHSDGGACVWSSETGKLKRRIGHDGSIHSLAWTRARDIAICAGDGAILYMWNLSNGQLVRKFAGHTKTVYRVRMTTDEKRLVSSSEDMTIRIWDIDSGQCLRILECIGNAFSIGISEDGRTVLSNERHYRSNAVESFVRAWDSETGININTFVGLAPSGDWLVGVDWPRNGEAVIYGSRTGIIFEHSQKDLCAPEAAADGSAPAGQMQYANAKVLLIGDTGVGKSGLAERLVKRRFVPTRSSHARKVHVLESQIEAQHGPRPTHREILLWDLAGQPAYRLVHQLSMEDSALACVLFDNRNEGNPFEVPGYWSQALDQSQINSGLKKLLIASRIDVGGLPASRERIEDFARQNGFSQFIATSAYTGEGCGALLNAIREGISWDRVPTVTTTAVLAALRTYIAVLKGEGTESTKEVGDHAPVVALCAISTLHEGFCSYFGEKISGQEFMSHLERLEAADAVKLLVFRTTGAAPSSETLVLLDPTRVDAYASALLVAAKDEPDGPGHLLESRVREANFKLDRDERIADPAAERHVLWFVMETLLARDLALRERIKGDDYIVFPSQCTAELRFPGAASFGVALRFAGPVRGIYATLIAQLAHFEGFKKREFFQDAATYRADRGGRCIVRFYDLGHGQGELNLSFESETPVDVRQGFLEFVGKHLEARSKPGSISKRNAYHCAHCTKPFEDSLVRARLDARQRTLLCPYCERRTPLIDLLAAPSVAAEAIASQIGTDARAGRQRMTAGLVIKAKEEQGIFDIFLSHNTKDKALVEGIAKRLRSVGIRPWLDKWNLPPGSTLADALEDAISKIHCAALCFGPADKGRWHVMEMRAYLERWANGNARMLPVILPGVVDVPELPIFIRQTLWSDMRDWEVDGGEQFYRLVCGILGKSPGESPVRKFSARQVAEWQGHKN
jgi:WD40 repeat protein/GTPase SAR1 family protein/DNA-directed RNA polymerase subunit RPC12/RpoP